MISISHWCWDADHSKPIDDITEFKTIVRFGSLEIRKQIISSSHYIRLDINTRDVLKPGIDVINSRRSNDYVQRRMPNKA